MSKRDKRKKKTKKIAEQDRTAVLMACLHTDLHPRDSQSPEGALRKGSTVGSATHIGANRDVLDGPRENRAIYPFGEVSGLSSQPSRSQSVLEPLQPKPDPSRPCHCS